ncbi:MAG: hypothetical protein C0485_19175 [Pirellula sp.]|nr:hypothetical protein [Pirellula sp.]
MDKSVIAAIPGHWLIGRLSLEGTRIQEALNDAGTDFLRLSDVEVHAPAKRECVSKQPEVIVPKCKLEFAVIPTSEHEAPEKRWNNRTARAVFKAFVTVGQCAISGHLHLPSKPADSQYTLVHQLGRFFALTEATFSFSGHGGTQLGAPLLFVNRDLVSCLHVDPVQPDVGIGRSTPDGGDVQLCSPHGSPL